MPLYRFDPKPKTTLFDHLQPYSFVLVTGPHRSGTTIAAAMIANDLGYEFQEDVQATLKLLREGAAVYPPTVFHCPSMAHDVHNYRDIPELAVIFVIRDIDDIIKSERRIPWAYEPEQLNAYRFRANPKPAFAVQPPISEVKYRYWWEVQKPLLGKAAYEVQYTSLAKHPLWVAPENRDGFTANQLEIGKPHGPKVQGRRLPAGVAGVVIDNKDQ
jgi:hypothetical protein